MARNRRRLETLDIRLRLEADERAAGLGSNVDAEEEPPAEVVFPSHLLGLRWARRC